MCKLTFLLAAALFLVAASPAGSDKPSASGQNHDPAWTLKDMRTGLCIRRLPVEGPSYPLRNGAYDLTPCPSDPQAKVITMDHPGVIYRPLADKDRCKVYILVIPGTTLYDLVATTTCTDEMRMIGPR